MGRACRTPLTDAQRALAAAHADVADRVRRSLVRSGRIPRHVADEAEGWAALGLVAAARTWREGSGSSFTTWVKLRVVGAILDGAREWDWIPRKARHADNQAQEQGEPSRLPGIVEVSVLRRRVDADDLDPADPGADEGADVLARLAAEEEARAALAPLSHRSRLILAWRAAGVTQREIGRRLGLTESRVSQLERLAREAALAAAQ